MRSPSWPSRQLPLRAMGADAEPTDDGMIIRGGRPLSGAYIETAADHRIAMSFAAASLIADGNVSFSDEACVAISYPGFRPDLNSLMS